jgi:tellurite resistance protein TehA-like permease
MIVISASGSSILPYVGQRAGVAVMVASIMMWSLGLGMSYIILAIYFWRLMKCKLPARESIISCFVPVGPLGMGAYAIQNLAAGLATHINTYNFTLGRAPQAPVTIQTITAIAESIRWLGTLIAFCLLGLGTFFLVEAIASVWAKFPRSFNIGFWSFVFPCGVYANALCQLSTDLRNSGLKYFAATCVLATILLWLGCALATFYHGVWLGKLFFAPGQQGWAEQERIDELRKSLVEKRRSKHAIANGGHKCKADMVPPSSGSDGTCVYSRRGVSGTPHTVRSTAGRLDRDLDSSVL